jgi:WD40 repeat protein
MLSENLTNLNKADESPDLFAFIHDAKRFALYNRSVIEQTPLQSYCSALIFSPEKSIIRAKFEKCIPTWIQGKPKVQAHWNAAIQTLEGHTSSVSSVAFSPDGKQVVSGSDDTTVRLWDAATGTQVLPTLEGKPVVLRPDNQMLLYTLVVSNDWVIEGGMNMLWLPTEYRTTHVTIWSGIVVLGLSSGKIIFLEFLQGLKLL